MSSEKETQKLILDYLSAKGYLFWRNNTGNFKGFYKAGILGSPDIFVVKPPTGQLIGIEVKDVKGKLSEGQELFRDRLNSQGGVYVVARSIDDVINFI